MTDALKQIYNACDPYLPATAEYYYNCAEARGSSALAQEFKNHLRLAKDYKFIYFLFSGHIGCGKSSELEHLARALTQASAPDACYFPILINVSEYLDDYDTAPTDILLAIVTELADTLRRRLGFELKDNYFVSRFNEIKQFFLSDVEINEGELQLGFAKAKVQRLKKDPTARQQVRAVLEPKMSTMLEEINTIFDEARLAVKKGAAGPEKQSCADIVLILDNLEKIRKIGGLDEGLTSQRELFLERYTQLTGMKAHFIYTVPLRLVRSADGPQLEQRYGPLFVLPMIKVVEHGTRQPYQSGVASLRALLQKRLGKLTLDQVFIHEALDFLLTYSGGHVRNLMSFVQNACTYTESLPIPLSAAQKAIQQTVRTYSTAIPEHHWEKLARLDLSPDQKIPNGDNDYLVMLENLSVLEYINGGGDDPFALAEPWYAVNPIVRQLQKFKAAVQQLRDEAQQPKAATNAPSVEPAT
ncbi:MAG TPA: hypothetical protein VGO91_16675 [Pyrinomonadaceae bacterium]|jgi:hypothetical protein|nr:hypothetical protein [Pyrinomonadaceae bacterium]